MAIAAPSAASIGTTDKMEWFPAVHPIPKKKKDVLTDCLILVINQLTG